MTAAHDVAERVMLIVLGAVGIVFAMQGALIGTVLDGATGAPLTGAVVGLPDVERTTTTGSTGRYAFHKVPAGPQHLTVRMIGFAPRSLHALVPADGAVEINVALRAEPVRLRTVEVRAPVRMPGLEVATATGLREREISMAAAANHPALAEPDALQALGGGEVVVRPESPSGVHIRGGESDHTAYVLDGIPILSPYHAAGTFGAWNPDALSGVRLASAAPSFLHPHALSGAVVGMTRAPGNQLRAHGGASTTHARLTIDGPLRSIGAGYVVSVRSGFPGVIAPRDEGSYVHGELGDWLAKLEAPLYGGRLRLLAYASENELDAASAAEAEGSPPVNSVRNSFAWQSQSTGVEWSRALSGTTVRVLGWMASSDAGSTWAGANGIGLTSQRRETGALLALERNRSAAGIRIEGMHTSYRVDSSATDQPVIRWDARVPVVTVFAQHATAVSDDMDAELGTSIAAVSGGLYAAPRGHVRWHASENVAISAAYAHTLQFVQSGRNAESIVGSLFPADLYVGAGKNGPPIATSDQLVVAGEYRPWDAIRVVLQGYTRVFDGLALVAPRSTAPFATDAFVRGSGTARGASLEGALSGARYGVMASYGWQQVRLRYGDSSYAPDHGTTHLFDGGVVVFPTMTTTLRIGMTAGIGRRTSVVTGGLEWESCNLIDQGCEFGGSPHNENGPPGTTSLPPYVRVDLGIRKHWHVQLGRRDVVIAAFGTVTNVFGRRNTLTYVRDPASGEMAEIGMRPLSPLVVGLDWRF